MSALEGGGRAGGGGRSQRPSAAPGSLPADAASVGSASSRPGGGGVRLAAAAQTPGAARQPPAASSPRAATPGAADAPRSGLAALSLHSPGPGDGAAAGGGAPATRPAPPPAATSHGAAGAASSSPGASASASCDGAVAGGCGVPGQGPDAAAASLTPAGNASLPGAGLPEPVGDDGLPLSAETAASPLFPPPSERHAAFLKLVDHTIKAGLQRRDMRNADFSALAAEAGVPLFGGDSIIVASLRTSQAVALSNQASVEPDPAEKEALLRRSWVVLLAQALPVLQRRMDEGTLLQGRLRKVEEAYKVYEVLTANRVTGKPVPGAAALQKFSSWMGYNTALHAANTALLLLPVHPWRSDERSRAQAFVLAALRFIPKMVGLLDKVGSECNLVNLIERHMTPARYGADFCASVLAVWRSRAVADVLRSRGSLQSAEAVAAYNAAFEARQKADLAKRGLRRCALPSCGKQEATVLQFRVCGHCQTTRYCCPEHAKQLWKAHKREHEAEEEEERGEAGGGGVAAA